MFAGARVHPAPPQDVLHGSAGGRSHGSLQRRGRGGMSLGDQLSETVEHQIARTRSTRRRRQGPRRAADLHQDIPGGDILRQPRRAPGGQVGLAREVQVGRLQPPRRLQQQRRSIGPVARAEGDLGAQQLDQGTLGLVKRPGLRRGGQPECRLELADGGTLPARRSPANLPPPRPPRPPARYRAARLRATAAWDRRPVPPPRPAAGAARQQRAARDAGRSSPRSARSAPARPAGRSHPTAARRSIHTAVRATPADSPVSRRRSGP